jgi:hypothetical protein
LTKRFFLFCFRLDGLAFLPCLDFETAEVAFDTVQQLDPYRLDDIDIYSNMLYVMPKLGKLAQVAKEYCEIDRNRPETCCLIGWSYPPLSSPSLLEVTSRLCVLKLLWPGMGVWMGDRQLLLFSRRTAQGDPILQTVSSAQPGLSPSLDAYGARVHRG